VKSVGQHIHSTPPRCAKYHVLLTATSGEQVNRICCREANEVSTTIMLSLTYIFSKHG